MLLRCEQCVRRRRYASVPGPTFPNRLYAMSATSHGYGDNSILQSALGMRTWAFAAGHHTVVVCAHRLAAALAVRCAGGCQGFLAGLRTGSCGTRPRVWRIGAWCHVWCAVLQEIASALLLRDTRTPAMLRSCRSPTVAHASISQQRARSPSIRGAAK